MSFDLFPEKEHAVPERLLVWLASKARESLNPMVQFDCDEMVMIRRAMDAQSRALYEIEREINNFLNRETIPN